MSGFLLDTNVLSEFSGTGQPNPRVSAWLRAAPPELLCASVLTVAEIRRGIGLLPAGKRRIQPEEWLESIPIESFRPRVLPVTQNIAERWAIMSAAAQRRGLRVAVIDGLIAATGLEYGLTVVTRMSKTSPGQERPS